MQSTLSGMPFAIKWRWKSVCMDTYMIYQGFLKNWWVDHSEIANLSTENLKIQNSNWNSKLETQIETQNSSRKSKFEIQIESQNSKLKSKFKIQIKTWNSNWNSKLKSKVETQIKTQNSYQNSKLQNFKQNSNQNSIHHVNRNFFFCDSPLRQ